MTTHQAPTPSQEMIDEIRETCKRQIEDKQRELNKANRETRRLRQQLEHTAEELDEVNQDLRRVQADSRKANSKASKDLTDSLQQEKRDKEQAIADKEQAIADKDHAEMRCRELRRYRRSDWQVTDQISTAIEGLRQDDNSLQGSGWSETGPARLPGFFHPLRNLSTWQDDIEQDIPLRFGEQARTDVGHTAATGLPVLPASSSIGPATLLRDSPRSSALQMPDRLRLSPIGVSKKRPGQGPRGESGLWMPSSVQGSADISPTRSVGRDDVQPKKASASSLGGGTSVASASVLGDDDKSLTLEGQQPVHKPKGTPEKPMRSFAKVAVEQPQKPEKPAFEAAARPSQETVDRHMEALKSNPSKNDTFFNDSVEQYRRVFRPNKLTPEERAEGLRQQYEQVEAEEVEAQKLAHSHNRVEMYEKGHSIAEGTSSAPTRSWSHTAGRPVPQKRSTEASLADSVDDKQRKKNGIKKSKIREEDSGLFDCENEVMEELEELDEALQEEKPLVEPKVSEDVMAKEEVKVEVKVERELEKKMEGGKEEDEKRKEEDAKKKEKAKKEEKAKKMIKAKRKQEARKKEKARKEEKARKKEKAKRKEAKKEKAKKKEEDAKKATKTKEGNGKQKKKNKGGR